MKKLLILILCLVSVSAFCAPIPSPSTPKLIINATDTPLPVTISEGGFVGYPASITMAVSTDTAKICPSLGTATKILVWASGDCNFGGADVSSGTTGVYIPGDCPLFSLAFSTSSPVLYFRMRDSSGTIRIWKAN